MTHKFHLEIDNLSPNRNVSPFLHLSLVVPKSQELQIGNILTKIAHQLNIF